MSQRRFSSVIFGFCCAMLLWASSCNKCRKVECVQGECVDGVCVCPAGLEGEDCSVAVNLKFAGTFTTDESCTAGSDDYSINLEPETASNVGLRIAGLWDQAGDTVTATVEDDGITLTIARQSYAGNEIEGSGEIGASLLSGNITYRIYNTGSSTAFDECTLSYE